MNNETEIAENVKNKKYQGDPKNMIKFAKFIAKELDVKVYCRKLYFKDGYKYFNNDDKLLRAINKYQELSSRQDKEVMAQLLKFADFIEPSTTFKIAVRNGVITESNVLESDCSFTPFYLDVTYDPNAYDENVDNFLKFICNEKEDLRLIIEEMIGHCLLIDKFPHKLFFLVGNGANGKSTLLEMLSSFCGNLASHIDISNFEDGTHLVSLIGKIVNMSDDVDSNYLVKSKILKTLASGNTIDAREIYGKPVQVKNTATLIFTANVLPHFKDKSYGLIRRLIIIPFDNRVTNKILNLDELLSSDNAKSYILNLALKGIERIYNNNLELSDSTTAKKTTSQYILDNDSVLAFINSEPSIVGKTFKEVFDSYITYAKSYGKEELTDNMLSRRLTELGYARERKTINGKTTVVIAKENSNNKELLC